MDRQTQEVVEASIYSHSRHAGCLRNFWSWRDRIWHFGEYVELLVELKFNPATAALIASMAIHDS